MRINSGLGKHVYNPLKNWLMLRLEQNSLSQNTCEQELADGRWLLCSDYRAANGYRVGIRTDITKTKQAAEQLRQG